MRQEYNLKEPIEKFKNYNNMIVNSFIPFIKEINIDYELIENKVFLFKNEKVAIEIIALNDYEMVKSDYIKKQNDKYNVDEVHLLTFYEDEWVGNMDICKSKIKQVLRINTDIIKVNARECLLSEIYNEQKNSFLNKYHIQGTDTSTISIGAFSGDILIALMTFVPKTGDSVNGNNDESKNRFELSRFCTNPNYSATGIFNKLIHYFVKNNDVNEIVTFADLRFSLKDNNIYEKNGFKKLKVIQSKYAYININNVDDISRHHRFSFGKRDLAKKFPELYKDSLTEKEITSLAGFKQIFDAGKIRYLLEVNENKEIKDSFGYIYKITNKINGKIYIGQTLRYYKKRFEEYRKKIGSNNIHLNNAFNKYGIDNFTFEVIDNSATNIDELNEKEIYYINFYETCNREKGYNISSGGRNSIVSEETKLKMSLAGKGKKQTEEHVNKRIARGVEALKHGRPKTEEQKQYLSEVLKGENSPLYGIARTEEVKKKSSETKIANGNTQKVVKWDIATRTIIGEFNSISEASKSTGNGESTIRKHCKHEVKVYITTFLYRYQGDTPNFDDLGATVDIKENIMTDNSSKTIEKFDLKTGEVIKTYETIIDASQDNDLNRATIVKHCNGEMKMHIKTFSFRYKDFVPTQKEVMISEPNSKDSKFVENDIIVFDMNNNEIVFSGLTTKDVYNYFSKNNIDYEEYTVRRHLREFPKLALGISGKYIVCKRQDFEKNSGYIKPKIEKPTRRKQEIIGNFKNI